MTTNLVKNFNVSVEDKINFVNLGVTTDDTKEFFKDYDYRKDPLWKDHYTSSKKFSKDIKKVTKLMDEIREYLNYYETHIWGEDEIGDVEYLVEKFDRKMDKITTKMLKDI